MNWIDIACIVFVCVTANHLGLISAIEERVDKRLLIINCPKCITFWSTMAYGLWETQACETITVLAISFLASYSALWLELLEGYVDTFYMKCYEKITSNPEDDKVAADADWHDPAGTLSDV